MPQHDSYTPPFEDCETLSRTLHVDLSRLHDVEIGMTDEGTAFLKLFVHNTDRAVKLVGLTVGKDACFTFSLGTDEVGNVHSCRRLAPRSAFSPDRLGCRLTMHGNCVQDVGKLKSFLQSHLQPSQFAKKRERVSGVYQWCAMHAAHRPTLHRTPPVCHSQPRQSSHSRRSGSRSSSRTRSQHQLTRRRRPLQASRSHSCWRCV